MFDATSIDDLTIEQYNMLIELLNSQAKEEKPLSKYTTSIVSVGGNDTYGDN